MEKPQLTQDNYHTPEMSQYYVGASQFKSFCECEVKALAEVKGEYVRPATDALLFGSYVDAYFSGTLDKFIASHPEMFNSKTGELKAAYKNIQEVIDTYENDPGLKKGWSGEHQVIMTGEIEGVPVKIMIDSYFPGKAAFDGKVVRSITEPVWIERVDEETGETYNVKTDFVIAYGYDITAAIYQEVIRQNTGKTLPYILNVVTKEECPDKALIQIDQDVIDAALEEVKAKIKRFDDIKKGLVEPKGCGRCSVCRSKKTDTRVMSYKRLFKKGE